MDKKKLIALRGQCKATFTKLEKYFQEPKENLQLEEIIVRQRTLNDSFEKYKDIQAQLMILDGDVADNEDDIEERYIQLCVGMEKFRSKSQCEQFVPERSSNSAKLPPLDIRVFDGRDVGDFKPFMDMFVAVIHNDLKLSSVQKLFYLKRYIKAEPLQLIDNLPLINESYSAAHDLLKKRYDNPSLLINNHISILLDMPMIHQGTAQQLRDLVAQLRQQMTALKNLNQPVEYWDSILVCIIKRKLDPFTTRLYHSDRDLTVLPSVEELLKFLEKRAISLEAREVSLLLAADVFFRILKDGEIEGGPADPILLNTRFGYIISGSFSLHKWCSNHLDTLSDISSKNLSSCVRDLDQDQSTIKTLGLSYDPKDDVFKGRENYDDWCFAAENVLVLEGMADNIKRPLPATAAQIAENLKAKAKLILTIDASLYVHIKQATTTYSLWQILKNMFDDSGYARKISLLRNLISIRLENCESMTSYVSQIIETAHKLNGTGFEINDQWIGSLIADAIKTKLLDMSADFEGKSEGAFAAKIFTDGMLAVLQERKFNNMEIPQRMECTDRHLSLSTLAVKLKRQERK
ncbi:hypothetical protein EVAR_98677_1 [Eumeta japonica]|uniref:Uncharacterized protein n=1 Tax=Eumeta variegata TaxID=151549 RepID=A0A4C1XYJ1_EUMVA|nr:hypothetical protein EVAR_98677_1 [Eumeta japonica]